MTHPNPSPTRPEDDDPSHIDATHRFAVAILDALTAGLSADQIGAAMRSAGEVTT